MSVNYLSEANSLLDELTRFVSVRQYRADPSVIQRALDQLWWATESVAAFGATP